MHAAVCRVLTCEDCALRVCNMLRKNAPATHPQRRNPCSSGLPPIMRNKYFSKMDICTTCVAYLRSKPSHITRTQSKGISGHLNKTIGPTRWRSITRKHARIGCKTWRRECAESPHIHMSIFVFVSCVFSILSWGGTILDKIQICVYPKNNRGFMCLFA